MFFTKEEGAKALGAFLDVARAAHVADKLGARRLSHSKEIVSYIYKSPKAWDERCTFNIKNIGAKFLEELSNFDPNGPANINSIYVMCYRFLCEYDFLPGSGEDLSEALGWIKREVESDISDMNSKVRSDIIYASYIMPANITKNFIHDANIGAFKAFEAKKDEAEKLKNDWDKEIASKKEDVDNLKNKLGEYKIGFNFVGLDQGFSGLETKKNKEAFWLLISLLGMGSLILALFGVEIISMKGLIKGEVIGANHLFVLIPLISTGIILIYFFRVILLNHRSVKAQLMQIELRRALCQFIQSYTEYSAGIKKDDEAVLEKFESLIFSGIISSPDKVPSTFDGMEQISKLIKNIKK